MIRADNGIGSISTGVIAPSVGIILQEGGSVVTDDAGDKSFVIGAPLQITVTGGPFLPRGVIFTYGLSDSGNPFNINLDVPDAWKLDWIVNLTADPFLQVQDVANGATRNYSWVTYGDAESTIVQGIHLSDPGDGASLLQLWAAIFDSGTVVVERIGP